MAGKTQAIDMTGRKCGLLTVLRRDGQYPGTTLAAWLCLCDCGKQKTMLGASLRNGTAQSCGCMKRKKKKHGKSDTSIYNRWLAMIARCSNPKNSAYESYGRRGVLVCESWLTFKNFYADMGDPPSRKHSIDRIDNNGNYEPGNCRWATMKEQANNTRRNVFIYTSKGRLSLREAAAIAGITYEALQIRKAEGLTGDQLIAPKYQRWPRSTT